jgi:hypothetical protein
MGLDLPDQPRPVLLCIARNPRVRLRDIAASLGITERSACSRTPAPIALSCPAKISSASRPLPEVRAAGQARQPGAALLAQRGRQS